MSKVINNMEEKCINTIRILAADIVEKANSGHPGAPMGCAPIAHVLFSKIMKFNPKDPAFFGRDRFVLSNGHACALLYSMLFLTGYDRPTMDDLKEFRQLHSVTAGHPENFLLEGVEVSTGPLGQGISNAVGLAIAEKHLAATYNKDGFNVIDNYTFVICGDGCLQEGISSEASSLAGHLKLGKLIVLYDDNGITIDGHTDLSFSEDVGKRYEAYGWEVLEVVNGNADVDGILKCVQQAKQSDKPTLIKVKTIIGFGSDKENTHGVHGAPLGLSSLQKVKQHFGFDPNVTFTVSNDVLDYYREAIPKGESVQGTWTDLMTKYKESYPDLHEELVRRIQGKLPSSWSDCLPKFKLTDKKIATRSSSGVVLNAIADTLPELMGGSADLTPSNKTDLKNSHDFQDKTPEGRYIRFGVREHGMAAISNGMAAYGGMIPYCATFLNFAGYALGAMRLSALSKFQVLYIFTHDSIGLGEDGPTHQPIEMLLSLRAIPNFYVFRPCDANEVAGAYAVAVEQLRFSPSLFALSRQDLPNLADAAGIIDKVASGGYILQDFTSSETGVPRVVIVSSGSEVSICAEAADILRSQKISVRLVSMVCTKLFEKQDEAYKKEVLEADTTVPVMSVEASCTLGWEKFSHLQLGINSFGKSAPAEKVYEYFGITKENIAQNALKLLDFYKGKTVPSLVDVPAMFK